MNAAPNKFAPKFAGIKLSDAEQERFFLSVDRGGECWIWKGTLKADGYGIFWIGKRPVQAHRAAFVIANPELSVEGVSVLHGCDVRACVNPDHLFLGTQKDNIRDMILKGRGGFRGEKSHRAKLTDVQIWKIREEFKSGRGNVELASEYGIRREYMWCITSGKKRQECCSK